MQKLKVFYAPGACSRVVMTALEKAGCDYEAEYINLMQGEQAKPAYKSINPRGKVPALLVDGELLTENPAILLWLNETYPEANLLPSCQTALEKSRQLSDLFWLSSVWHPYVRANMMPIRWTVGDPEPVRQRGKELMTPLVEQLDKHLQENTWYYGDTWSIADVYFYWNYTTAEKGEFDISGYANIQRHKKAIEELDAFKAALAKEKSSMSQ